MKARKIDIDVRERFCPIPNERFWRAIVTTRSGRCWYVDYTGDKPSDEKIERLWNEERSAFEPYYS